MAFCSCLISSEGPVRREVPVSTMAWQPSEQNITAPPTWILGAKEASVPRLFSSCPLSPASSSHSLLSSLMPEAHAWHMAGTCLASCRNLFLAELTLELRFFEFLHCLIQCQEGVRHPVPRPQLLHAQVRVWGARGGVCSVNAATSMKPLRVSSDRSCLALSAGPPWWHISWSTDHCPLYMQLLVCASHLLCILYAGTI